MPADTMHAHAKFVQQMANRMCPLPLLPKGESVGEVLSAVNTLRGWPKNKGYLGHGGFGWVYLVEQVLHLTMLTNLLMARAAPAPLSLSCVRPRPYSSCVHPRVQPVVVDQVAIKVIHLSGKEARDASSNTGNCGLAPNAPHLSLLSLAMSLPRVCVSICVL